MRILFCICAWLMFLTLLCPIILPIILILFIFRYLIDKILLLQQILFNNSPLIPMHGLEIGFTVDNFWNQPKGAIALMHLLDKPLNILAIQAKLKSLLQESNNNNNTNYERLTCLVPTIKYGYAYWKRRNYNDFNVEDHIRILHNENVEKPLTSQEFHKIISNWNASDFKHGCPVWDIFVIPKCQLLLEGENNTGSGAGIQLCSVFGIRIHHIIGDGYSLKDFIDRLFNIEEDELLTVQCIKAPTTKMVEAPGGSSSRNPCLEPSRSQALRSYTGDSGSRSVSKLNQIFWSPLTFCKFLHDFFLYRDSCTTNLKTDAKLVFCSTNCSLNTLKILKKNMEVITKQKLTLGSLLIYLFGRALRKYLIEFKMCNEYELPKYINIAASLPVETVDHPIGIFCNHWTHAIFQISIAEPNNKKALEAIVNNFLQVYKSGLPLIHTKMSKLYHLVPNLIGKWVSLQNIGTSTGFVNMPGPTETLKFYNLDDADKPAGKLADAVACVETIIPIAGLQWKHTCMTAAVYSYKEHLNISVLANQEFMDDFEHVNEFLNKYLQEEIQRTWEMYFTDNEIVV